MITSRKRYFPLVLFVCATIVFANSVISEELHKDPVPLPVELVKKLKKEGTHNIVSYASHLEEFSDSELSDSQSILSSGDAKDSLVKVRKIREKLKSLKRQLKVIESSGVDFVSEKDGFKNYLDMDADLKVLLNEEIVRIRNILYQYEAADIGSQRAVDGLARKVVSSERYFKPHLIDMKPNFINQDPEFKGRVVEGRRVPSLIDGVSEIHK